MPWEAWSTLLCRSLPLALLLALLLVQRIGEARHTALERARRRRERPHPRAEDDDREGESRDQQPREKCGTCGPTRHVGLVHRVQAVAREPLEQRLTGLAWPRFRHDRMHGQCVGERDWTAGSKRFHDV